MVKVIDLEGDWVTALHQVIPERKVTSGNAEDCTVLQEEQDDLLQSAN
jgi:hypothetical protein